MDRLTLAFAVDEILAYNELKLLRDVTVVKLGLIMRIAFPLATKESVFTVFRAMAVPIPQPKNDMAINWKLETPYLSNSENHDDIAFMNEYDLSRFFASTHYPICLDMIATESGHESCPATPYFKDSVESIQTCETG